MKRERVPPGRNPFLPGLLAEGDHFADRETEVERIREAYRSPGSRLVVYGERRMGKTSALHRAAVAERRAGTAVAIATFATASDPADASRQILLAVREQIGRDWRTMLESIVARLQGAIELRPSPVAGAPPVVRITFGLREEGPRSELIVETLDAVSAQLEAVGGHLALALDEFQRIHEWGGEDAEWALKSALESHRSLSYVLAGSKRHLIEAMITRKGRALWKQVDAIAFGPIPAEEMAEWIHQQAARTGVALTLSACDEIVRLAGPRTRDIVQLAREVWFEGMRSSSVDTLAVARALDQWIEVQSALYAAIWRERSPTEQRVLRALAIEPRLALTSADALQRYQLGPKSTVQATAARLVAEEYLVSLDAGGYGFDDPFFHRWLELHVLLDLGFVPPVAER
jgi:hypothetical protein